MRFFYCVFCVILGSLPSSVVADVRLPNLIGSQMVLQRDQPVKLWGWADADETVKVRVGEMTEISASPGADGKWGVTLPAFPAGSIPNITIRGKNTLTLDNLLAGDVWVCSGQSNMEMALKNSRDGTVEIMKADHPEIRFFHVANPKGQGPVIPQDDCEGRWDICSAKTAGNISGVGYYFAVNLQAKSGVPIGIIQAALGGSPAENWTPANALAGDPAFDVTAGYRAEYPVRERVYQQYMKGWAQKAEAAKAEGKPEPEKPRPPISLEDMKKSYSTLYNATIHPITPFPVRGVLWYQGESNAQRAFQYERLLTKLIHGWRSAWGRADLPFVIVQVANFDASYLTPGAWAELREAQAHVAKNVPNCALVVTIDTGGSKGNLHPADKETPGQRAALAAWRLVYGENVVASGPTLVEAAFEGDRATVTLENFGGGLASNDGKEIQGFSLAGADKKFEPAAAHIDGAKIVVRSEKVFNPVAVRYGWKDNPLCTLINREGLPAVPFRSDDWPGPTAPR